MAQKKEPLIIAITGGIGCGQTSVAKFFQQWGARVINADRMAHQVVNQDADVKQEIKKVFGNNVYYRNGKLKRKLVGKLVFEDESKLNRLNKIVHPRMVASIIDAIEEARDKKRYPIIALDAALIFELNLEHMFDEIVVVAAKMKHRIARISERDGLSEKEIRERIARQIPIEDKCQWSNLVIHNNGDLSDLEQRSRKVYDRLMHIYRSKKRESA